MRVVVVVLLAAMLSGVASVSAQEAKKELKASDIKNYLKVYFDDETMGKDRAEAYDALCEANKLLLSKALAPYIKKDDKNAFGALDLATELMVPGLWSATKSVIDEETLEDGAMKYGFIVQDKGAIDFLFDRWKSKEVGSTAFESLDNSFALYAIPLETVEKFFAYLKAAKEDDPKRESAFEILKEQVGADEIDDADAMIAGWDKILSLVKIYGRKFSVSGDDLLRNVKDWQFSSARKVCGNYFVTSNGYGRIDTLPAKIQTGNWIVGVRVYVSDDKDGARVSLGVGDGGWSVEVKGENWFVETGNGQSYVLPIQRKTWSTIEFGIIDQSTATMKMARLVKIKLDGKEFAAGGNLSCNGQLTSFTVRAGESSIAFGGVELVKKTL